MYLLKLEGVETECFIEALSNAYCFYHELTTIADYDKQTIADAQDFVQQLKKIKNKIKQYNLYSEVELDKIDIIALKSILELRNMDLQYTVDDIQMNYNTLQILKLGIRKNQNIINKLEGLYVEP
jgi:hypothetical protein